MTPIKDLEELIKNMKPLLLEQLWFYCCVTEEQLTSELLKFAFAMVRETESITLILPPKQADALGKKTTLDSNALSCRFIPVWKQ